MMEKEFTFQDYLYILFTKRWLMISIFLVTFIATLVYTFTAPKVYQATATIMIESGPTSALLLEGSRFGYPIINIRNYCEVLKSKAVAERTADILKRGGFNFSFLNSPAPAETLLTLISIDPVIESDIIKIKANGRTSEEAVAVANASVDAFIEEQVMNVRRGIAEQHKFLESQIPTIQTNLEESEKEIKNFKETNKIVSLSNEATELAKILAEFDKLYGQSEVGYKALQNQLATIKKQLDERRATLIEDIATVSSPYILQLRKELTDLQTSYSLYIVQGLSEDALKLVDLKNSIERTKSKIIEETKKIVNKEIPSLDPLSSSQELVDNVLKLEIEMAARSAEKDALLRIIKQFEGKLYSLPASEFKLAQLERERKANAAAYELLMRTYKELQISEAGTISNVRVVDRAGTSRVPVKPKKRLNLILGTVVGIVLALGGALLVDYVGGSIRTEKDVKLCTNLTVLGSIPKVRSRSNKPYLIRHQESTHVSEAYRTLRTNIGFANPDFPVKVMLITSSSPKEGKSTVASNLAIVIAQAGRKVLLADADLRKPALDKLFEITNDKGITNVLIKEIEIQDAIVSTPIENLSLISSGKIPPNPSELLESHQMDILIKTLKQKFDYVIFDTPPAVGVTDAAVLSTKVDGVIIVVEASKTNKLALSRAKESLERVNVHLLGVVLNKLPSVYSPYSPYGYYSYYRH